MELPAQQLTQLLQAWSEGDQTALELQEAVAVTGRPGTDLVAIDDSSHDWKGSLTGPSWLGCNLGL